MLALTLGLRFFRSRRAGALSRFMALASITGIALGTGALILGLSAMNGFEHELNSRVLSVIPSAELIPQDQSFKDADAIVSHLKRDPEINAAVPAVSLEGVLNVGTDFAPVLIQGIDPAAERQVISAEQYSSVSFDALTKQENSIIIGAGIASKLKLKIGDQLNLMLAPGAALNAAALSRPAAASLKVIGLFKIGGQLDDTLAFTAIDTAIRAAQLPAPNRIQIRVQDNLKAGSVVRNAAAGIREDAFLTTWVNSQGKLYHDIQMVRAIMYLAMILVMAVACFNIISNLIMQVGEKTGEIAILRTMGAGKSSIALIFICSGLCAGGLGTLIGLGIGSLLSYALPPVSRYLHLLNPDVYFIDFIPSRLNLSDVLLVALCALGMSLLAALYPALKAASVAPARVLNEN